MKKYIFTFIVFLFIQGIRAQQLNHDFGVFLGIKSLQGDYGSPDNIFDNLTNNTISIGVAHYVNFINKTLRWDPNRRTKNYIRLKTELEYITAFQNEHFGKYAEKQTETGRLFREMKGRTSMIDLGISLEYYLFELSEFKAPYNKNKFNPFLTIGTKVSLFTNTVTSGLGNWRSDKSFLPERYREEGAILEGNGVAASLFMGAGTRFKVTRKMDLSAEFTGQYFFSDKIDGLPNSNFNETLVSFKLGVVYHLNY